MKRHLFPLLVAVSAVLSLVAALAMPEAGVGALLWLAFPFRQLGALLRTLSLSGAAGNAGAWVLYALFCLLPALYLLLRVIRRRAVWPDALLAVLSAVLFFVMDLFINPTELAARFGGAEAMGASALGGTVYSLLLAYVGLRLCRVRETDAARLSAALRALLYAVACVLAVDAFGGTAAALRMSFAALREGNTALSAAALAPSYAVLVLRGIVAALPSLAGIAVILTALPLLDAIADGPYSGETVAAARRLARVSRATLAVVLLSQAALNVLQAVAADAVRASGYSVSLPLGQAALLLAALLLSELFMRGKALQDDHDSII